MTLVIIILITFLLGIVEVLIYGKGNTKRIIIPMIILLAGDFLLLYAKFVVGDDFSALILYLPSMILLVISGIWFTIIMLKSITEKDSKRKLSAIILSFIMTALIISIPSLKKEDKFQLYKNDFFTVSDALFKAYDQGKVKVGDDFASPPHATYDLYRLNSIFPDKVINKMKKLNQSAGVCSYTVADKDVIYFSYGAIFQSIDGIAICRNGKDPSKDETLKSRFFDGNTEYRYITDNAYHFNDGL